MFKNDEGAFETQRKPTQFAEQSFQVWLPVQEGWVWGLRDAKKGGMVTKNSKVDFLVIKVSDLVQRKSLLRS